MSTSKWLFTGFMLAAALLLCLFMYTNGPFKYVFSLGAVLIGMEYFKREETTKYRVWFAVLAFMGALFFSLLYTFLAVGYGWVTPEQLPQSPF